MTTTLLAVGLVHWMLLLIPGPNMFLVSHLAAGGQRRAAWLASLGISMVACWWALLAMLGVQALFLAMPGIRLGVQVVGGLYLLLLALRFWQSGAAPQAAGQVTQAMGAWAAWRMGLITNLLNPKSAMVFSSLFVAALPAQLPVALQAAVLAMVFCNAMVWHLFLAVVLSQPRAQAAYARHRQWLARGAGACLGYFGGRLLWNTARELRTSGQLT
jgi:threonine/homoserine/homoserine lactone efflux protein